MRNTYEQEIVTDRQVVATSPTYLGACELVDYLVSESMPREKLTIAAEELRFHKGMAGSSGARRAIAHATFSGAVTGLVFALLFAQLSWIDPLITEMVLALYGVLSGAAVGVFFGLAAHRFSRNKRSHYRVGRLKAGRYAVLATGDLADEATRIAHGINHPINQRAVPLREWRAALLSAKVDRANSHMNHVSFETRAGPTVIKNETYHQERRGCVKANHR